MTTSEQKRKIRDFQAKLRRERNARDKIILVNAIGGPFSGAQIAVSETCPETAPFRIGDRFGFYTARAAGASNTKLNGHPNHYVWASKTEVFWNEMSETK